MCDSGMSQEPWAMVVPGSGIMRACIVTVVRSSFVCPVLARDFVTTHGENMWLSWGSACHFKLDFLRLMNAGMKSHGLQWLVGCSASVYVLKHEQGVAGLLWSLNIMTCLSGHTWASGVSCGEVLQRWNLHKLLALLPYVVSCLLLVTVSDVFTFLNERPACV